MMMVPDNNMPHDSLILPLGESVLYAKGWDNAIRAIMLAGKQLPLLLECERTMDYVVPGCESEVWVALKKGEEDGEQRAGEAENKPMGTIKAYSPSKIIRGVLAILLEKANSLTPSQRQQFDFHQYMTDCQLSRYLSQSRGSGIAKVLLRLNTL